MLDSFFIYISLFTSILVVLVPFLILRKDRRRFLVYIFSLGLTVFVVYAIKYTVGIPRPESGLIEKASPRFPSGHTAISIVPVVFFKEIKIRIPFLLFSILVSYSRLHLNVHLFIDLVFGAVVGLVIPILVLINEDKITDVIESTLQFKK